MSACPILSQNENSSNWTQDITARCITTAFQVRTASSNTCLGVHQAHGQSIFPNILYPSLVFLALLRSFHLLWSDITRKSFKKQHLLDVCKLDILLPLIGYSPKCCGSFHDRSTKQRSPAGKGGLHGLAHAIPGAKKTGWSIFIDCCLSQPLRMNGGTAATHEPWQSVSIKKNSIIR